MKLNWIKDELTKIFGLAPLDPPTRNRNYPNVFSSIPKSEAFDPGRNNSLTFMETEKTNRSKIKIAQASGSGVTNLIQNHLH